MVEEMSENRFLFNAVRLPPQRRVARAIAGVRMSTVWRLIVQGFPPVQERYNVYFEGDFRAYVVTAVRVLPRHMELDLELLQ